MASLYEIDGAILALIDDETGEVSDAEVFEGLQMERETKIENIALWYKNLTSDAEQYAKEEQHYAELKQKAKKTAERLKQILDTTLSGDTFKTVRVAISYRKSESVTITDETMLPAGYLKFSAPSVDKAAIKTAIKAGVVVDGAVLAARQNIQIK